MDELCEKKLSEDEREAALKDLLVNIGFFQHERLVHLIVTILFAVLMMFSLFCVCFFESIGYFVLAIAVLVLLVPYIRHYYILENGVQKLYKHYDKLKQ